MDNVTIGTGCVVAAGSVVTKSIAPYSIVGGNPAKVLKMRFPPQTIELLLNAVRLFERPDEVVAGFQNEVGDASVLERVARTILATHGPVSDANGYDRAMTKALATAQADELASYRAWEAYEAVGQLQKQPMLPSREYQVHLFAASHKAPFILDQRNRLCRALDDQAPPQTFVLSTASGALCKGAHVTLKITGGLHLSVETHPFLSNRITATRPGTCPSEESVFVIDPQGKVDGRLACVVRSRNGGRSWIPSRQFVTLATSSSENCIFFISFC
jgi:hypothetical protein